MLGKSIAIEGAADKLIEKAECWAVDSSGKTVRFDDPVFYDYALQAVLAVAGLAAGPCSLYVAVEDDVANRAVAAAQIKISDGLTGTIRITADIAKVAVSIGEPVTVAMDILKAEISGTVGPASMQVEVLKIGVVRDD
jgi:hypothetical protein